MIHKSIIEPNSIVVVGGSNNLSKPGGKILNNIINGGYYGSLCVVNPKEKVIQGIKSYNDIKDIPESDLAILSIPSKLCLEAVKTLAYEKNTKGFIIISAGFGELTEEGKSLEKEIVEVIDEVGGSLIGPNCIGVLTPAYHGVFTTPIPHLNPKGCDLISSSGATAVFIMEAGLERGLQFANVISVGNAAQITVEDVLQHMDENFVPGFSAKIKLLYLEDIRDPHKFYIHASSLIRKGCKIAAIKSGATAAGGRAASSHTGALATSDVVIRALFKKAGIVYCSGRAELINVAAVFTYKELKGKNFAIITHAGGSAVMLSDALSKGGISVPEITNPNAESLLERLYPGSSVRNPIDFLATGTADQLGLIIDYCDNYFTEIDAIIVVFGSPGLFDVENVYQVLNEKMDTCSKPIFPVLPSIINAAKEIDYFLSKGRVNFPDEVQLGEALGVVSTTLRPMAEEVELPKINEKKIRSIIESSENGYLNPDDIKDILDATGIPLAKEGVAFSVEEAKALAKKIGYPIAMKVVGPVHKTDVNGVVLNVRNHLGVEKEFERIMQIPDANSVLLQKMHKGVELFAGAKHIENYDHLIMCGLGGIFIEVLKDVASGFSRLPKSEAENMLRSLKGYSLFEGVRGKKALNKEKFIEILQRISSLAEIAPEIKELDLNPLMANNEEIIAVDARIRLEK